MTDLQAHLNIAAHAWDRISTSQRHDRAEHITALYGMDSASARVLIEQEAKRNKKEPDE